MSIEPTHDANVTYVLERARAQIVNMRREIELLRIKARGFDAFTAMHTQSATNQCDYGAEADITYQIERIIDDMQNGPEQPPSPDKEPQDIPNTLDPTIADRLRAWEASGRPVFTNQVSPWDAESDAAIVRGTRA